MVINKYQFNNLTVLVHETYYTIVNDNTGGHAHCTNKGNIKVICNCFNDFMKDKPINRYPKYAINNAYRLFTKNNKNKSVG